MAVPLRSSFQLQCIRIPLKSNSLVIFSEALVKCQRLMSCDVMMDSLIDVRRVLASSNLTRQVTEAIGT
jgi:hypothetical protein